MSVEFVTAVMAVMRAARLPDDAADGAASIPSSWQQNSRSATVRNVGDEEAAGGGNLPRLLVGGGAEAAARDAATEANSEPDA